MFKHSTCLLLALAAGITFITPATSYPWHASCKITFRFPEHRCVVVSEKLAQQITLWKGTDCGDGGSGGVHQRCRYALVTESSQMLTATHTTPLKKYIDDLTMSFEQLDDGGCNVAGFSTSQVWYAVLDMGTNYCNLHNLVEGTGLSPVSEETEDSVCTQFTSADCDRY